MTLCQQRNALRPPKFASLLLLLLVGCAGLVNRPASAGDLPDQPPRPIVRVAPEYPFALAMTRKHGDVSLAFIVTTAGTVADIRVLHTSDPGFDEAAMTALAKWRFTPGRKNGRLVNVRMVIPFAFNIDSASADAGQPAAPDQAPRIILRVPPVYPPALLAMHKNGRVRLSFIVTPAGTVADIRVVHTTDPEFDDAAAAAVGRWQFFPAMKAGRPVNVRLEVPIAFNLESAEGK